MNYIELFGPIKVKKFDNGGSVNEIAQLLFDEAEDAGTPMSWADALKSAELKQATIESRSREQSGAMTYLNSLQRFGLQGKVSVNSSGIKLNPENGAILGGSVTTTYSDGTTKTREMLQIEASGISDKAASGLSTGMQAVSQAVNGVDKALMGNKNFGGQSEAVDAAVHGTSSALMKSGNPYAQVAGAALEVANFATKATGDSVAGFDVDINSSGYGNMGHKDQKSNRDWGAAIGLGGLFGKDKVEAQIALRNREMQMALKAANIAEDVKFEQEARANSVEDVIQENQIALQGGVDTSLLVARQGGKIIRKAQDGAKLEDVKVSKEENVLPTGELHKNKHDLDLDNITEKGIPVVVVDDDSAETFEEVKAQEDSVLQQAEVEALEIIFNKELTDYLEENHKKVKDLENPEELLIEVGKRLTKEILQNTKDNDGLIEKIEEKENGAES